MEGLQNVTGFLEIAGVKVDFGVSWGSTGCAQWGHRVVGPNTSPPDHAAPVRLVEEGIVKKFIPVDMSQSSEETKTLVHRDL